LAPLELAGCPGKPISLSAAGSSDPDGNRLTYRWWVYRDAGGLFPPEAKVSSDTGEQTTVTIGGEARVDQFTPPRAYHAHIILEATDNGTPALTRYRRAVITVPGSQVGETAGCAIKPIPPAH
jgi:hypothetical protein